MRRLSAGIGAFPHEHALAALMELPTDDMAVLPARFEGLLAGALSDNRVLSAWVDPNGTYWARRFLVPPVRPVSVTISSRSWRSAMKAAHRWKGYAERLLVLGDTKSDVRPMQAEASHYGIGLARTTPEGLDVLVDPQAYSPRRFTPARWLLAEEIYEQFRVLTLN